MNNCVIVTQNMIQEQLLVLLSLCHIYKWLNKKKNGQERELRRKERERENERE